MAGQDAGSSVMTEERGRQTVPNQGKKRCDASKPRGEGTWEQVLAEVAERMEKSEHTVETLEGHVLSKIDSMKEEIQGLQGTIIARDDRIAQLEGLVLSLQACIEGMREDVNLCKRVASNEGEGSHYRAPKVELPKPKSFGGKRDAKEVENFLWKMEVYFESLNMREEATKVRTATLYLTDTAMLW
ncbi:hypothetical protein F511_14804 [Dorcoceras hygrometricum]|uniref:Retrotransposon gag domain-containing protein n=1 Tax=Dorcoceras hygrometricum TaxID=472368 RepID=A0A2Z7C7S5_9LAMI|nr:hypothetical protein F511_14804 [Dorcoceras hygrometricum]